MGATFVITLREAFEASLLLGIVYGYLDRIGAREHFRWVTLGGVLGLALSVAMGVGVGYLSGPLLDLGPDVVAAVVMFAAVGLLTWHAWWMQRHARALRGAVEERIDAARQSQRLWMVGLIAFVGVFREGAETVLFLWGIVAETASAGWSGAAGGAAGVVVAAALGWVVFRGSRRVSLSGFFAATTLLILLLAAGLFSTGVGRLEGLGLLPRSEPLWDTSRILSERSTVGSFLSGLTGYRSRPSALEAAAYAIYLAAAGSLVFGASRRAPAEHPSPDAATRARSA